MSEAPVEILFFQVGTRVYASAVHDVVRIGSVKDVPAEELVFETALGAPFTHLRGVVVAVKDGEKTLVVDQVLGVRTVLAEDLKPLPAFVKACILSGALAGLVLVDEVPTPLVDLSTLVNEGAARAGAAPPAS